MAIHTSRHTSRHPLVSVLVPAYNVERYLPALHAMVAGGSYPDFEMIIADDCSADATLAVARELARKDPRVKVIARPDNSGGAFMPRLDALRQAQGDLVCPLDADDMVSDRYLECMVRRLCESGADIVYPRMLNCRESAGERVEADIIDRSQVDPSEVYEGRDLVWHTLYEWHFGCNGGLYRKDLYHDVMQAIAAMQRPTGGFTPTLEPVRLPFIDEVATRMLLIRAHRVAFATDALYRYVDNPDSVVRGVSWKPFSIVESDLWLRDIIRERFGTESEVWGRLQLQNVCNLVNALVTYRREKRDLTTEDRERAEAHIALAWRELNLREAAPHISPLYRVVLSLGRRAATLIFSAKAL